MTYLKHSETGLEEAVKCCSRFVIQKFASEKLHSQQGKDEDEETQEDQQSHDGGDWVDKRLDEVTHSWPVFGDLEASQKTDAPKHGQADWWNNLIFY